MSLTHCKQISAYRDTFTCPEVVHCNKGCLYSERVIWAHIRTASTLSVFASIFFEIDSATPISSTNDVILHKIDVEKYILHDYFIFYISSLNVSVCKQCVHNHHTDLRSQRVRGTARATSWWPRPSPTSTMSPTSATSSDASSAQMYLQGNEIGRIFMKKTLQGDHSGCAKPPVLF